MKRVFLIVLDSLGAGEAPDAASFGDRGAHTLKSVSTSAFYKADNLLAAGLGNIPGLEFLGYTKTPTAAVAKMRERSAGKDTTIGHWEIAGLISNDPLPTYPNGFPDEVIDEFSRRVGRKCIVNKPYSGTEVIKEYGKIHEETGDLIVYTSADSVFQIAAHEDVVPVETLYAYCRAAREILTGKHGVGRVIARPFVGKDGVYTRTSNRHDFSLEPSGRTVLDAVKDAGKDVIGVGKINDIFAGVGITESIHTSGNTDGLAVTLSLADRDFDGLCFVNLVDFDSAYGHRNDIDGYAKALAEFDGWLPSFLSKLGEDDAVLITADHGCDPGDISTDHTREFTPLLVCGKRIRPVNLGLRDTFADIASTVAELLGVEYDTVGKSFAEEIVIPNDEELVRLASEARRSAYAPYSGYTVGAALKCADGKVYKGCNIENGAFSPTVCAERTAFFKAVSEGKRDFVSIAVVGGEKGKPDSYSPPCGVCRQVMSEFCGSDFSVLLLKDGEIKKYPFSEVLPLSFKLK